MISEKKATQKATRQVKWTVLIEIVNRSVTPIITVVLARILAPEAFGLVSTAAICIGFAQMFWDAGLSKAIIQTDDYSKDAANVVFWSNLFLGVAVYLVLFSSANVIAVFFRTPQAALVLRVTGLQIILGVLSSVQRALLMRHFNFKRLLWVQLATAVVPGCVSLPLALAGCGVWALVVGTLTGQSVATVLFWVFSRWRPVLSFNWRVATALFSFGMWVQAESFGAWLMMYGDSIVVGRTMGMEELGVYRTGWTMLITIFGLVLNPILQLILPTFARLQSDRPALIGAFHRAIKLVLTLAIPMAVGVWLCGAEVASVFFGTKWVGLGFVLQNIGLGLAISWLTGINTDVFRAIGKPKINTCVMYGALCVYLPIYYVAAQFGLRVFVFSRVLLAVVGMLVNVWICHKVLGVKVSYLWEEGRTALLAAAVMGVAILLIKQWVGVFLPGCLSTFSLAAIVLLGTATYLGMLLLLDRGFVFGTYRLIKRSFLPQT